MEYESGKPSCLLDIIEVPMIEPRPHAYHTENHLIDDGYYWKKKGKATWDQIVAATDSVAGALWFDGDSSYHGINDKVPEAEAIQLPNSLRLIKPQRLDLVVGSESKFGGGSEWRVRANFRFGDVQYKFVVTDPWIENKCRNEGDGTYKIEESRLCISLAEILAGYAIKLVAAVIMPD